ETRLRYVSGEVGAEGGVGEVERRLGYTLTRLPDPPPPPSASESFVGWFPQKQAGLLTVGVVVPMGRLTWQQMEGLAVLSKRHGDGTLRTSIDQNLLLPNVPSRARAALGWDLASLKLAFEADALTRNTVVCTGQHF